ncbi:MAG: bh protein [Bacillaceae bacterium]|nr:bh protein [Bacillaceae bacterium ZC4]REJ18378.1 MAG: bh protein [Bacillaceae bacterium]REJ26549.1 MAG: bh protein [Bacillaceae bacterium]RZI50370.1 bh protein [Aeribacillus pallidus]
MKNVEIKEMEATLFCIHCNEEQDHIITYINDKISRIECANCHHTVEIKIDLLNEFYHEVYEKIVHKPAEITEEYRNDLSKFLLSLPIRIIKKPYSIYKYMKQTRDVFKTFKEKQKRKK